jgi:hypothetical protein
MYPNVYSYFMPIRIAIQSPGLSLQTLLADEVLPHLLELVQKHRVTPPAGGGMRGPGGRRMLGGKPAREGNEAPQHGFEREPLGEQALTVRQRISGLGLDQVKAMAEGRTFVDRVVLLTGFAESRPSALPVTRLGLRDLFVRLKDRAPANFGRELAVAWNQGLLDRTGKKEVALSNAGWARLVELLPAGV